MFLNHVYIVVGNFLVACLAGKQMGRGEGERGDGGYVNLSMMGSGKESGRFHAGPTVALTEILPSSYTCHTKARKTLLILYLFGSKPFVYFCTTLYSPMS